MCHGGSWALAQAIASWVTAQPGGGDAGYVEWVDGRAVVLVMQAGEPDVLWVLAGQHLVYDPQQAPRWRAYGAADFDALYAFVPPAVRELPIFSDGEVA